MRVPARGFTFLGLMFLIALMGIMATAAATTWAFVGQREKELDLLFAGRQIRVALARYAAAHARQAEPYPTDLRQLLGGEDKLVPVRYLRRLYLDPMTGTPEWGLVRTPQGGITAVYSLSMRAPVRRQGPVGDEGIAFEKARDYRDWVFRAGTLPGQPPAPGQAGIPDDGQNGAPPLTWENPPPTPPPGPVDND